MTFFASCEDKDPEPPFVSRTVLAYIAADNNLSTFATEDKNEMIEGFKRTNVTGNNLLIYIDNGTAPQLIRLEKTGKNEVKETKVWQYEKQNSVDVNVMSEVFDRVFTDFPAQSYGLVLWSHADGWIPSPKGSRHFGDDKGVKMDISALLQVLKKAPHFDFILFDACFMQTAEVAYELQETADYIIGSPTEIPGPGAPYEVIVPAMFAVKDHPFAIAKSYYDYYASIYNEGKGISNVNWTGGVSISLVKTRELRNLADATSNIIVKYLSDKSKTDISNIMCYDNRSSKYYHDIDGFIKSLTGNNKNDYNAWKDAYSVAVPYYETTSQNYSQYTGMFSMEGSSGLSVYIPRTQYGFTEFYKSYGWYRDAGWKTLGW